MVQPFIRIQDVADILIMSFLVYQLYTWFRSTRAMQVLLGLGVVTLIYFATRFLGLYMTSWILQELGTVLIVLVVVVFQSEIRQALYRFSLVRHLFYNQDGPRESRFQEIADTVFSMAAKRTGALLVFQRSESLADLMLNGVRLDCEVTPQILESIFSPGAPLHDGASLIKDGRIVVASCHLPLSVSPDLPQYLGTRHRAAMGLSERTDAIVVAVSEERGVVTLAADGVMTEINSPAGLVLALEGLINPATEKKSKGLKQIVFNDLVTKTAVLLLVISFWALITSRQGQITTVSAPVRMHGIPEGLALIKGVPDEVEVQLRSYSILTPMPSKLDLVADVDISEVREGHTSLRIKNSDFNLPSGMVISRITPPAVKIVTDKKERKRVPIKIVTKGVLPVALQGGTVVSEPATIEIEGPSVQVSKINSIITEEVDISGLYKGKEQYKSLIPPMNQITVLREEPVVIKVDGHHKKTSK